jgi:tetratricopeptide (TPR) repeat protein
MGEAAYRSDSLTSEHKEDYLNKALNCYDRIDHCGRREVNTVMEDIEDDLGGNYYTRLDMASFYAIMADSKEAPGLFKRANELFKDLEEKNPNISELYSRWAISEYLQGNMKESLEKSKKALSLLPSPENQEINDHHAREIIAKINKNIELINKAKRGAQR